MKRLNPETGKPFKQGDIGPDGKIFRAYGSRVRKKDGFYPEVWQDELTFYRKKTQRKLYSRAYQKTPEGRAYRIISNSKNTAKDRNIYFKLTIDDILPIVEAGYCQLTGLPFDFNPHPEKGFNPYAPSMDRIDSNKGYTKDNIRIVLWAVNAAVGESTDEEMLPILKAMVKAIERNVNEKSTTSLPARADQQGEVYPKLGTFSATGSWKDNDNAHNYLGTISGQDIDYRAQASCRDSMAYRSQEVESSVTLTRIENHGDTDAEIVRLDFSRRHLSD